MTRNVKSLVVAAAAAVILIVAAVAVRQGESRANASEELGLVFPELMASVNDVAAITVTDAEGSYTVSARAGVWGLEQKAHYPAKMETVRKTILSAAELKKLEAKTDVPARYSRLGVEDVDAEGAESKLLVLSDSSGAKLAELLVGNPRAGAGTPSTYVRVAGEARSWLAGGELSLPVDASAWLDKEILKLERDQVQAVEITHPDGERLSVSKGSRSDEQFEIHDVPADHELKYASVANGMCGALEYLNLQDVVPAEGFAGSEAPTTATFWSFDGLRVDATVHTVEEKHFATFHASFDEEGPAVLAAMGPLPTAEEGEDGEGEDDAVDPEAVRAQAAALNERLGGWTYEIALYNQANFTKRMTDMVKPIEPPAEEEEEQAAGEAGANPAPPSSPPADEGDEPDETVEEPSAQEEPAPEAQSSPEGDGS
ncbi:MAG: DUF4340 domain-containing protein [Planctomycetota bacterium]|jgi:hypothetical protein|nr:DUF4340 domain-containing protein [Planctomycetota bacterium]MDP6762486.1 DUF4340 domain-containing protein [Planctomycetota bacterium]MDP6990750.1 DUF4340 domain-containing protein [Planctomycetota bacterium]